MDDHNINETEEIMEDPEDPEEWEDDEWDDDEWEDDEWDDEDNKDDEDNPMIPPEITDHNIPLKPFTPDGDILRVDDDVQIVGDINKTKKEVYVSDPMHQMINNGKKYRVNAIHKGNNYHLVGCGGWNWSIENIRKLNPDKKVIKKQIFHYDPQHIDLE
jgi:hypothetical protein